MKKLFEIKIKQENEILINNTCEGNILLSPTCGGVFAGISKGKVEPIGMLKTYAVKPCTHNQYLSVVLTDDDGNHILVDTNAFLDWSEEVEKIICEGNTFDKKYYSARGEYYAQGTATIKTDSNKYKHLERKVFKCTFDAEGWNVFIVNIFEC